MYYLVILLNSTLKSHPKVYTKVIKLSKTLCVRQPLFTLKSVIKVRVLPTKYELSNSYMLWKSYRKTWGFNKSHRASHICTRLGTYHLHKYISVLSSLTSPWISILTYACRAFISCLIILLISGQPLCRP